ncbi:MAG: 5-bromo-4-chloroindolyl phosphate hydrolysis family protein [Clostridia bacterium]|nr:5-bromo-4-chloroindolyl phosphate hydrolysis family protein [Clostridia bacterium]
MSNKDGFEIDGGWVATTVMLALVFPIGLIMLFNKVKKLRGRKDVSKQMRRAGISVLAAGIGMTALGVSAAWGIVDILIGGGMIGAANKMSKKEKRFMRYLALIGNRPFVAVADLAAAIPVSVDQAREELQTMIEQGYFGPSAYLDPRTQCLVLDSSAAFAQAYRQQPIYAEPVPEEEPVKEEKAAEEKKEPDKKKDDSAKDQYQQWIESIREVNDRIDDRVISEKIDRIELLTKKIFEMVKKRPDKEGQIRKFLNYYLPTTLKLLDSYALLEEQGIEGDNITASKKQIEGIMDTLIQGFEKQLDQLFSAQAMDINSDIEVLENMMAVDGLKENQFKLRKTQGS